MPRPAKPLAFRRLRGSIADSFMTAPSATLRAELTPWYHRRMLIMLALFLCFGAYFAYDWQIGYPKKKVIYDRYLELREQGEDGMRQWAKEATENKWKYEDSRTLEPFNATDTKIREQMWGMLVCFALAAFVGGLHLRSRGTTLGFADGKLLPPHGPELPLETIRRVDTRKWLNKGIAAVWYEIPGGKSGKTMIDGLKYGGFKGEKPYLPDQILEAVVKGFHGELIELSEEDAATDPDEPANEDSGTETGRSV